MSEEQNDSDDKRRAAHQHDELLGIERRDGVLSLVRELSERCHGLLAELLELHARYFLIRAYNLVPHLHHQLKGDVRLFDGDHDVVHIAAIAFQQIGDLLLRASVEFFHLVDGGLQHRAKIALALVRSLKPMLTSAGRGWEMPEDLEIKLFMVFPI